jgi:Putative MetA-pathway of phenol degradation
LVRRLTVGLTLAMGSCAYAQEVGSRVPESAESAVSSEPTVAAPTEAAAEGEKASDQPKPPMNAIDRLRRAISQDEDSDGPINTDRPTFTPANTVVPKGRLQFESGWTYNAEWTSRSHVNIFDFPELAMRYGLAERVEFRMFWEGQIYGLNEPGRRGRTRSLDGPDDMEVGFKWQLFPGDEERKWIPTTALITSIYAPTGGTSPYSSETVEPYVNLIWGWGVTKKLTLSGSEGYLGIRETGAPNLLTHSYNYQRFSQSVVAFYTVGERSTLFYEWYILMFTNAPSNLPLNYMDGGIIYRLAPNIQVDIRAGFGLSGRPDDFFTGTGFSIRF